MKKPINEIAKLKRLAGLITESEYQEEIMNTEAKSSVSKEEKIQVIKEWIWYCFDEGTKEEPIQKWNAKIDNYFADKDDVTFLDFKNIWNEMTYEIGVGDVGADSEGFGETWNDVQKGILNNPGKIYEGKEKEEEAFGGINENSYLMAKNPDVKAKVDKIIELLIDIDVDGETMEYILGAVGMDDQMANQLVHNKAEYQSSQMNEALKPHVYDHMYNLSSIEEKFAMVRASEIIMNDLTEEGFEIPEIKEFLTQLINEEIF